MAARRLFVAFTVPHRDNAGLDIRIGPAQRRQDRAHVADSLLAHRLGKVRLVDKGVEGAVKNPARCRRQVDVQGDSDDHLTDWRANGGFGKYGDFRHLQCAHLGWSVTLLR